MRYVRLYIAFVRFAFMRAMEFRLDFFFRFGMDVIWYAYQLAFFEILFLRTPTLLGMTPADVRVFIGAVFVMDAFHMTVFATNMWWFPIQVNRGDLDFHLVRPVSSLFFLSVREFAANSFFNLVLAIGVLVWMISAHPADFGAVRLAGFVGLLLVCSLLHHALNVLFLLPVIWMHNAAGLRDLFMGLGQYMARPDVIYRGWVRRLFTVVLPFAVLVSFPVRALLGPDFLGPALQILATTAVAYGILAVAWRFALRAYSSASS
ncbi:MAG: ABC-2 family transporter protein [Planctomycetes bacterium]|nr:ABC-2 family transporter protein [Planctomycetota bacterium]MCB9825906.1 ABC-2 family transporter protein [Planctomycetota bacterium]MCB9829950.1 ABC-2 family transporter protein [Planctomycetota bacterium]MCB9900710.1 ABC-2 family transporter protein [Planctomycetota bacterium]